MTETFPLKFTVRHAGNSPWLAEEVEQCSRKLAGLRARISRCEVLVEPPGRRHRQGAKWRVRIDVCLPGAEVVVDYTRAEDPYAAIHQAFALTERRIESFRQQRMAHRSRGTLAHRPA